MMQSATSRLRHTFKYPSEDTSANTSRDELDEEQQESLLTSLSTTATKNDNLYRLIFTVLPLASMLPLIRNFFISPGREYVFPGVLGVTSLGITGWDMWRCSVGGEDALGRQGKRPSNIFVAAGGSSAAAAVRGEGPLLKYLPYLNGTIAVLLLVLSFVFARREEGNGGEGFWLLLLLPAVNLGVVTVVKRSMVEVERGLGELRGLRYEYKGA